MSWSMNAVGTVTGVKNSLGRQKVHGTPSAEEAKAFADCREMLINLVERSYKTDSPGALVIFDVAASGHGDQISYLSMKYSIAFSE